MKSIEGSLGIGRAYRVRWSDRLFTLLVFAFAVGFALYMFEETPGATHPTPLGLLAIGAVAIVAGIATLSSFYKRVTLYANAIEYRSIWSTSWLQFAEIRGRRAYLAYRGRRGNVPHLQVVPNDERLPLLDFEKDYNFDDAFWAWFNSLPDLDHVSQSSSVGLV